MKSFLAIAASLVCQSYALISDAPYFTNSSRPLVLAHRGSAGLFPEHTLGAYSSAFVEGTDFVELDIQITKDGHLITSHDPTLKDCSNVMDFKDKYADRMGNFHFPYPYENSYKDDFLVNDFTLEEIKSLNRKMRYSHRNQQLNHVFKYLTLNETIELMFTLQKQYPRAQG